MFPKPIENCITLFNFYIQDAHYQILAMFTSKLRGDASSKVHSACTFAANFATTRAFIMKSQRGRAANDTADVQRWRHRQRSVMLSHILLPTQYRVLPLPQHRLYNCREGRLIKCWSHNMPA